MKLPSILLILSGIFLAILSFFIFKKGDIIYGISSVIFSLILLYFGIFKRKYRKPDYGFKPSVDNYINISGSKKNDE